MLVHLFDQCLHMQISAATRTAIGSVCLKCGVIGRSGKSSCCGRGGSWFGNCGSAGNSKVEHRWYEGLQACKTRTQFKIASGEESNAAQQPNSSDGVGTESHTSMSNTSSTTVPSSATHTNILTLSTPTTILIIYYCYHHDY